MRWRGGVETRRQELAVKHWNTTHHQILLHSLWHWMFGFRASRRPETDFFTWIVSLGPIEIRRWSPWAREIRKGLEAQAQL